MRRNSILCKISTPICSGKDHPWVSYFTIDSDLTTCDVLGYYPVNIGLPNEPMRIMAIGDLNNDKYNDIVTTNSDGSIFSVHYFEESNLTYVNSVSIDLPQGLYIDSVVVMKAAQPYQSLLIVASEKSQTGETEYKTKMLVYDQVKNTDGTITYEWALSTTSVLSDVEIMAGSQPMLLDINGDQ